LGLEIEFHYFNLL